MAVPASNTDVGNLALDALGLPPVNSIDAPQTNTELVLSRHYDESRRWTLRRGVWGFAKARATLAIDGASPLFDFSDRYKAPNDFVRLLQPAELIEPDVALFWYGPYEFSGGYLLTNSGGAPQLNIRYIQDVTDVTLWDVDFPDLVATRLAYKCCMALTGDKELAKLLKGESEFSQADALATNGQENRPIRIQRSRSLEARRGLNRFGRTILGGTWADWNGPNIV